MPHDSRWPAWLVVILGLLVVFLALHVATPRVRLSSGEHLRHPTAAPHRLAKDPRATSQTTIGEEESLDGFPSFSEPPKPYDLP